MAPTNGALDISTADADLLLAAQTLGGMRNSSTSAKPPVFDPSSSSSMHDSQRRMYPSSGSSTASASASDATPTTTTPPASEGGPTFMTTMSNMRFVGPAIRVYEQTKASSTIVKYGAEMMEGTVMTMTKPVIDRLPVTQLNEFAGRQLDRFGMLNTPPATVRTEESTLSPSVRDSSPSARSGTPTQVGRGRKHLWIDDEESGEAGARRRSASRDSATSLSGTVYSGSVSSGSQTRYPYGSEASSSTHWQTILQAQDDRDRRLRELQASADDCRALSSYEPSSSGQEVQVVSRSKWQAVLLEAGGIGAAVSEESMKRLKYCLQWLQYANHHIDQQIVMLRSFIASITPDSSASSSSSSTALVPFESLEILARVKRELISTIRQVVDVVSKYAGSALPEQAKASVRSFILMLPERWSSAARAEDPSLLAANGSNGVSEGISTKAAMMASTRVLTLATESLDMMRSITSVFKDSLDRAEAWVDRLQQLGLQRQAQQHRRAVLPVPFDPSSLHSPLNTSAIELENTREGGVGTPSARSTSLAPSTRAASVSDFEHDEGAATETEADNGLGHGIGHEFEASADDAEGPRVRKRRRIRSGSNGAMEVNH